MSFNRQNNTVEEMENYIIEAFYPSLEEVRQNYPKLIFSEIGPEIINVEVPKEGRDESLRFDKEVQFLNVPVLFGLNAKEPFISSNITTFHNYPYGELRGKGILVGFIDTGIQYTNINFQEADHTTRIVRIWDQTIAGNPPKGFTYGSEYTKEQIDSALVSSDPYSIVPSRDEIGHGTFLAGVAAGDNKTGEDDFIGGAPEASIVMVKLRSAKKYLREYYLIDEEVPAYQENDVIAGITYLLQVANFLRMPLAICIGLGANLGGHGGSNITERYLQTVSVVRNIGVVIAAGNEASSGHHFSGQVENDQMQAIEINVAEGEMGFQLVLWADVSNKLSISIKSPLGLTIPRVPIIPNQVQSFPLSLEKTIVEITYFYPDTLSGGENIYMRFLNPTPGIWTVYVNGDSVVDGRFNVWLPRNGFILENTRFLKPDPNITVQIPGTGAYTIVVGGYDYTDNSIYVSSGRGPTLFNVIKPDFIAPCVNVKGPSLTGGYTTYVGTSIAAAITTSAIALLLEWSILNQKLPTINTRAIRAILIRGAARAPGGIYPNNIEGYGRLDLQKSIELVY